MSQPNHKKILVLGAGMVGRAIVDDLAQDARFRVGVADRDQSAISRTKAAEQHCLDLSDGGTLRQLAVNYDLVVGALPSWLGRTALDAMIDAGRDYCDVSFMSEDPLTANSRACERGVTVVVDCGVAPGLTNMLVGAAVGRLDRCQRVSIAVGGLPKDPRWPFNYKAGFSPRDVLEEYTRPVRMVEDGRLVEREALSDVETITFAGVGVLEAFQTDGLRTLLQTVVAEQMSEKTVRYPGHAELMRVLRHLGLFSRQEVSLGQQGDVKIRPIDLTERLLFPHWRFEAGEADLTVMRVIVEGESNGCPQRQQWELLDRYDAETGLRSMSRVTAFSCTSVVRLMATGRFQRPGVNPPEHIGAVPELLQSVLDDLGQRGVVCSPRPLVTHPG